MRAGTTRTLPFALTAKSASLGARLTAFSSRLKYASAAGPVSEIGVFAVVGSCRILARRQRGMRKRVGPAVTTTGAAITCEARR